MSDALLLVPLLGIAFVLILLYNVLVIHWADADEAWNRYELVVRVKEYDTLQHCSGDLRNVLFKNYARAKDAESQLEQIRIQYWHASGRWPVFNAWQWVVLDHKTMEIV